MKVIYDISYILNDGITNPNDEIYVNFLEIPVKCDGRISNISMVLFFDKNIKNIKLLDKMYRIPLDKAKFFVIHDEIVLLSEIFKIDINKVLEKLNEISKKLSIKFEIIKLNIDNGKLLDILSKYTLHERKKRKMERLLEKDIITAINDIMIMVFSKKFGIKIKSNDKKIKEILL